MEIKELNYIVVIAEEGSISKAAERLFMAQSSLSQFLMNLECRINSKLFVRTSTGVRPTEAGRLFIEYAYQTLSEYHMVRDKIQDVNNLKGGRVILGISSFRGTFLLPPVLQEFHRKYSDIHVIIIEENSMALEQRLQNGTIDLALIVLPTKILKHNVEVLLRDEICIITNPEHPVMKFVKTSPSRSKSAIKKYVNLKDTLQFEFLLSDYDTILGRESRKIFREHDLVPKTYNEKLTAFMAASMGAAGLGLAFTYYSARNYYSHAEFLSLGEEGTIIDLGVSLAPERYHSKATLALRKTMVQVLGA